MLLSVLRIKNLYQSIDLQIKFNEQLTLLVGINGSGKTSVLNIVNWLLKPDFQKLAIIQYDLISLHFSEGVRAYVLTARKSLDQLVISLQGHEDHLKPITIGLRPAQFVDEDDSDLYAGLRPEPHELPLFNFLRELPSPTFISLDRTISAESDETNYVEVGVGALKRRQARSKPPIAFVQGVTSERYSEFRAKAIQNDNELKANIVMSALQDTDLAFRRAPIDPMSEEQINQLEEKVSTYLSATIKSDDVRKQVRKFFKTSRMLTKRQSESSRDHDLVVDVVIAQYRQIESLAKAFNDFERKNASAFRALRDYLAAVNRFFADSSKELLFDQSTGKLVFLSKNSRTENVASQSITRLSSGERQILILFTFLAFTSNPQSVFIVDEPELSLHPKWQAEFLDAFLELQPKGTQLLLATHSPDIVGKYKKYCVALKGKLS